MASARKCDRCGNYYDISEFYPYLRDGKTYKLAQLYICSYNKLADITYDLCPACMEKLMVFLDDFDKSKERFEGSNEDKFCMNCEYYLTPIHLDPCISCEEYSHWHEKTADDPEKEEE